MPRRPERLGQDISRIALAAIALSASLTKPSDAAKNLESINRLQAATMTTVKNIGVFTVHEAGLTTIPPLKFLHIVIKSPAVAKAPSHRSLNPAQIAAHEVTPQEFFEWSKVNTCEEGGNWHTPGPEYPGGLGISYANWKLFGGQFFAPTAATATDDEQIVVARRIQSNPPDQNGCDGSW